MAALGVPREHHLWAALSVASARVGSVSHSAPNGPGLCGQSGLPAESAPYHSRGKLKNLPSPQFLWCECHLASDPFRSNSRGRARDPGYYLCAAGNRRTREWPRSGRSRAVPSRSRRSRASHRTQQDAYRGEKKSSRVKKNVTFARSW